MPRNRMIKPEFWGNEQLAECSFGARLMFIGLMNFSDDNGILENRHKKFKINIFPADNVDVGKFINELISNELIEKYESNGQEYIWIINFIKHQKVEKPKFIYPLPPLEILRKYRINIDSTNSRRLVVDQSSNFEQDKTRQVKTSEVKTTTEKDDFCKMVRSGGFISIYGNPDKEISNLYNDLKITFPDLNLLEVALKFKNANKKTLRNHILFIQGICTNIKNDLNKNPEKITVDNSFFGKQAEKDEGIMEELIRREKEKQAHLLGEDNNVS